MIRLDIDFNCGFKYATHPKDYKKVIAMAKEICDRVPSHYRFFTFQAQPQFFIEFGETAQTEKKLKQVIKKLPSFVKSAKIAHPKARNCQELILEREILHCFASFVFARVLLNQHKEYRDFNERKLIHVFMNMRLVNFVAEIGFCLDHVKGLVGIK